MDYCVQIAMAETIAVIKSQQMWKSYLPEPEVIRKFLVENWALLSSGEVTMNLQQIEQMREGEVAVFEEDYESRQGVMYEASIEGNSVSLQPEFIVYRDATFKERNGNAALIPNTPHEVNYVACLTNGFTAYYRGQPWTAARKISGMDMVVSAFIAALPEIKNKIKVYIGRVLNGQ
jgi:hypothetical protein